MQALKNEIKQKAIFMSLINIKETIKNIQDSADAEVMVIFCEEDMKRPQKVEILQHIIVKPWI